MTFNRSYAPKMVFLSLIASWGTRTSFVGFIILVEDLVSTKAPI